MRNTVYFLLLMGIVQIVSGSCFKSTSERKSNTIQNHALLIGGGTTEGDNFESFFKNIDYASNTLKKLGYSGENITILFYGGKTLYHPVVEGNATKENFIDELIRLGHTIDSNDSLVIFRSGHGMVELVTNKNYDPNLEVENRKWVGTEAVMRFPDGTLSYFEFQEILEQIRGKQIIVILNQCFAGQFLDIAMSLDKVVVITETRETQMAINDTRKTLRWQHDEWPFVKCIFDGFLQNNTKGKRQSVFNAFQYMLRCNPSIEGIPVQADRPLLKENPQIKYGSGLKKGTVYID